MDIQQVLRAEGGVDAIADQLGIPREQAEQGVQALLPAVVGGFGRSVENEPAGLAGGGLGGLLEALGGDGLARNVTGPEPTEIGKGNDILGQIFGSKQVSREVAGQAAQTSGLDPALLKRMLPILAMLVAGYLARSSGGAGGLGSVLGQVLGGMGGSAGGGGLGGGLGGVLGSILGGRR